MMAARNKKTPGRNAKVPTAKELEDRIFEDDLTDKEDLAEIMKLEEISLRKYLEDEPDIYTLDDLKVRY